MFTNVMSALLERHAVRQSPSRIEDLVRIFIHATHVSAAFHLLPMDCTDFCGRWRLASGVWVLME